MPHCASLCITGHLWAVMQSIHLPPAPSISTASERKKALQEEKLEIFLIVVTQEHCIQVAFVRSNFFCSQLKFKPDDSLHQWVFCSLPTFSATILIWNFLSEKVSKLQITPLVSVCKNNFHPDEHLVYHRWFLGRDDLSVQWALLAGFPSCCQNQKIYLRHIQTISRHGCRSNLTLSLLMFCFLSLS